MFSYFTKDGVAARQNNLDREHQQILSELKAGLITQEEARKRMATLGHIKDHPIYTQTQEGTN